MPIYEYQCEKCCHTFEILVFSSDEEQIICPECRDKRVRRLMSCSAFLGQSAGDGCSPGASGGFS